MDLHSGLPYWLVKNELYPYYHPLRGNHATDVAIIGSGITGALAAHELCNAGIQCCVIDKRSIATGSSVASTALLQYEIDVPLCEMVKMVGEKNAVTAYRCCLESITDLEKVCNQVGTDFGFKRVSNVFYASDKKGLSLIKEEYETRIKHGLPVEFLTSGELQKKYGIKAPGALYNTRSAQMDAYLGAVSILQYHLEKSGLKLFSHTEIEKWKETPEGYSLITSAGHTIKCRYVVVAAGFEAGKFLPRQVMSLSSTYAIISQPVDPKQLWRERSLIWETEEPYLYVRTTADNRIIAGGEDEPFKNEVKRDKLLRKKIQRLEKKVARLFPHIPFVTDMAWCGTFSSTEDGLPYIGAWPGKDRMFFALGYGGNGITFSMIAAQIIRNKLQGKPDERTEVFGFERGTAH